MKAWKQGSKYFIISLLSFVVVGGALAQVVIPTGLTNAVQYIMKTVRTDDGTNAGVVNVNIDDTHMYIRTGFLQNGTGWNNKALGLDATGNVVYVDANGLNTQLLFPSADYIPKINAAQDGLEASRLYQLGGLIGLNNTNPVKSLDILGDFQVVTQGLSMTFQFQFEQSVPGSSLLGILQNAQCACDTTDTAAECPATFPATSLSLPYCMDITGPDANNPGYYFFDRYENIGTGIPDPVLVTQGNSVGIRTSNPQAALHVRGDVRIDAIPNGTSAMPLLVLGTNNIVSKISPSSLGASPREIGSGPFSVQLISDGTNDAAGSYTTVGGVNNKAIAAYSTIAGGGSNIITGTLTYSAIGGGAAHVINGEQSTIAGGGANHITGNTSTIAGGFGNSINANHSSIGGGTGNTITAIRSTIAGGLENIVSGAKGFIGGGQHNNAQGQNSVIAGGQFNNTLGTNSTIAGGDNNTVDGDNTSIGGGTANIITTGPNSTIGGGQGNTINLSAGDSATIAGGKTNTISATYATIAGGWNNIASGISAFIGGGYQNTAAGQNSTIAGGDNNTASGDFSTIPGGRDNQALGNYSLAAGQNAIASGTNSFVWSDGSQTYPTNAIRQNGSNFNNELMINTDRVIIGDIKNADLGNRIGDYMYGTYKTYLPGKVSIDHLKANNGIFNTVTTANGTVGISDQRLKTNILTGGFRGSNALIMINSLNPITYNRDENIYTQNMDVDKEETHYGLIAQEIAALNIGLTKAIDSEAIGYTGGLAEGGFIGVKYTEIIPILIQAIKEQQLLIEGLQQQIDNL